jgi:pimeloyl-ACP methyl ester carboxylesterase
MQVWCGAVMCLVVVGCFEALPGVGTQPPALGCDWADVDIYRDVPTGNDVGDVPVGTIVGADHIAHVDAMTLSLKASVSTSFGAEVYRVLYVSNIGGERVLVSGRIAVPDATAPSAPGALVAHQHGTFGFGDDCAPSKLPDFGFESELNPNAARALSQNYVVMMTDYPGLGTPGMHPYVSREATGASVLDGILAAQHFCDSARGIDAVQRLPTILEGHSQGAHATVAALTMMDERADEFDIRAAVAIALPAQHGELMSRMVTTGDVQPALVAMGLVGQLHAHETLGTYDDWFLPEVSAWLNERADEACAPELSGRLTRPAAELFGADFIEAAGNSDFAGLGLAEAIDEESLVGISDVPLLVLHGDGDSLIPVEVVRNLAAQWPASATLEVQEGEDHWVLPSVVRERVFAFVVEHLGP